MNDQNRPEKFYWMKLKKNVAKSGKNYWTGNLAYAIDVVGFEKDDGTMTVWMVPKDMGQMKQAQQQRASAPAPKPPPKPQYVDHSKALPPAQGDQTPWPGEDEIPF